METSDAIEGRGIAGRENGDAGQRGEVDWNTGFHGYFLFKNIHTVAYGQVGFSVGACLCQYGGVWKVNAVTIVKDVEPSRRRCR
jgi:hypothetical protein